MIKPTGTVICQRCGSIQCGKLDLVCDNCNMPNWDAEELKYGLGQLSIESPQPKAECTCDGLGGNNDIYCPIHCQPCYSYPEKE